MDNQKTEIYEGNATNAEDIHCDGSKEAHKYQGLVVSANHGEDKRANG